MTLTTRAKLTRIDTRLADLARAAIAKGEGGFMVLYADLDHNGYWEKSAYGQDPGRHYTEEDKQALDGEIETLFIIEYVKDWRGVGDQGDPVPA